MVSKKVKENGIETEAVVTRIEERIWSGMHGDVITRDSVTYDYYITYTNRDGQSVEAMLTNFGNLSFQEGDRMRIKYLPDRQDYPVFVKIL